MKSDYLVTALTPVNSRKTLVYINEEKAFALYNKEVRRLSLSEGGAVSYDSMKEIYEEILYPRARERAFNILESSAKTSDEIRRKLREGFYPEEICSRVISLLEEYGYLNDFEYARAYVSGRIRSRSMQAIKNELYRKGISDDIISRVLMETEYDETDTIIKAIRKRGIIPQELGYKEKSGLCASLLRKGYKYDNIVTAMERMK